MTAGQIDGAVVMPALRFADCRVLGIYFGPRKTLSGPEMGA